nr:hypothetical protein [Tanacetum cinerariifolium]
QWDLHSFGSGNTLHWKWELILPVRTLSWQWKCLVHFIPNKKDSDLDVKEDTKSSSEFLADLIAEFHDRVLLANQKRLYERFGKVRSDKKPMDKSKETCFACGLKAKIVIITKKIDAMSKGKSEKGLVVESFNWDKESVSSEDEGVTRVKAFITIVEDEPSVRKVDARLGPKVVFGDNSSGDTKGYGLVNCNGITFARVAYVNDHLGKFDEKADDGFFLGYSLVAKAFRVFNIRRQEIEETYHVTVSGDDEAISKSSTKGDKINFNEKRSFTDEELLVPRSNKVRPSLTIISPSAEVVINPLVPQDWGQSFVAMSSVDAEYVVAAGCCAEVLWIKSQLADYDVLDDKPEKSLILEDTGDKSLFGTTVHLVSQSIAKTNNKPKKKNIPSSSDLEVSKDVRGVGSLIIDKELTEVDSDLESIPDDEIDSVSRFEANTDDNEENHSKHKEELPKTDEATVDNIIDELADISSFFTKVENLESSLAQQVAEKIKDSVPRMVADAFEERMHELLSDTLKNILHQIIKDSIKKTLPKFKKRVKNTFKAHVLKLCLNLYGAFHSLSTQRYHGDQCPTTVNKGNMFNFGSFEYSPTPPLKEAGEGWMTLKDAKAQMEDIKRLAELKAEKKKITYDNDGRDQSSEIEMKVLMDGKQDNAKVVKVVGFAVEQNNDNSNMLEATQAGKLGIPPPPELTAFKFPLAEKKTCTKRKINAKVIHEVFVKDNVVVDDIHRNLVPLTGVVGSLGLVIEEPKVEIFIYNGSFDLVFQRETLPPGPAAGADAQALEDWVVLFYHHNEVACLMLGTMSPKLYKQFEHNSPLDMVTELQKIYGKPLGVELQELVNMFHSCKQAEGQSIRNHVLLIKSYLDQLATLNYAFPNKVSIGFILNSLSSEFQAFVQNYNMQSMEKTISEVHSLLIEFKKSIKRNKQPIVGKDKGKGKGKGPQNSYPTKPKKPQPYKKERPTKDRQCHHCKEEGHWKRNYHVYLAELMKKKKKTGGQNVVSTSSGYPKENMGYYFYYPRENKIVVERYADFLEKDFILQKESGRIVELEDEDILPSESTSEHPIKEEILALIVSQEEDAIPVRRYLRTHKAPDRLCQNVEIDPDRLCFNVEVEEHSLRDLNESTNYKAALSDPEFKKWLVAMNTKMQSMYDIKVWRLVVLPPNAKVVKSKWIYKKKMDMDGKVHIYKARLVVKGCTQTYGVDYEETFSLVADIRAIRILIAIAAYYDYEIWQMDVKTVFLNGFLEEEIYMEQPEGEAVFILGIKIYRDRSKQLIRLNQIAYLDKILKRYRMDNSKRGSIPMQVDLHLSKSQCATTSAEMKRMQNVPYTLAIGSIMYAVSGNLEAELRVNCYCDAVFETDKDDTKSQTGYVFVLNGGAVVWKSSKQSTTPQHASEAEYIAASEAAKEAVWIRKFIDKLGVVPSNDYPIKINYDNSTAIIMAKESGIQKDARHFKRKYYYVCECIETSEIDVVKVHTYESLADPFTKALAGPKLTRHARSMGLRPASSFM